MLKKQIPSILEHYEKYIQDREFNRRLYKINEGQIRTEVEDSLRKEILSIPALNRCIERIPSINIAKRVVKKLSKVYFLPPMRTTDNTTDQSILEGLERNSDINTVLHQANELINLSKSCLIEPFIEDQILKFRTLSPHQFLVFSDDKNNPLNPTVVIKFMGRETKSVGYEVDENGKKLNQNEEKIINVSILGLYSKDEVMVIDTTGEIRLDKMQEMGLKTTKNPYGVLPFLYVNTSKFELIPYPNQEALDISILIPKLLTDLNYAAQFMSHSLIWTKNADISGASTNPDSWIDLGETDPASGSDPEIGTIEPKTDIERVLQLIQFTLSGYFASIGMKSATMGSMMPGREASGVAKMMDESDVTEERKVQVQLFKQVERQFWKMVQMVQNYHASQGELLDNRLFTEDFYKDVNVKFNEMKPLESEESKLTRVEKLRDMKLITKKRALKMIQPDLTDDQIEEIISELNEEQDEMTQLLTSLPVSDINGDETDDSN